MTETEKILVPDVGDAEEVTVVEILVSVGDVVSKDDAVVVLESDKASMDIPSPAAGKVSAISVSEGDVVNQGDLILELESDAEAGESDDAPADDEAPAAEDEAPADDEAPASETTEAASSKDSGQPQESSAPEVPAKESGSDSRTVVVPDVGDAQEVTVVEVLIAKGDQIGAEDSIVVLESDKASMDIPAGVSGTVTEILVSEGQEVKEGDELIVLEVGAGESEKEEKEEREEKEEKEEKEEETAAPATGEAGDSEDKGVAVAAGKVHAGPAVRKQAREYGVELTEVKGSGRKGRILKEDVRRYVKDRLSKDSPAQGAGGIPAVPAADYSKYGEVELQPLSRVRKSSARNLHRSWLNVPHVTQFDEADISDLETFRKTWNEEHKAGGVKVTPLAFLVKICATALIQYPGFNASLDEEIESLILKHYYNIGIAVDTDDGLVVPVIKDADKKGVVELAKESAELAAMARDKKLPLDSMQGATFTISSLGGIGGTAFTPIVNAPEVAILGVSRARVAPVFDGQTFVPRTLLPLSLSYDHRAIDGAQAARFTGWLARALTDVTHAIM